MYSYPLSMLHLNQPSRLIRIVQLAKISTVPFSAPDFNQCNDGEQRVRQVFSDLGVYMIFLLVPKPDWGDSCKNAWYHIDTWYSSAGTYLGSAMCMHALWNIWIGIRDGYASTEAVSNVFTWRLSSIATIKMISHLRRGRPAVSTVHLKCVNLQARVHHLSGTCILSRL